MHFAAEENEEAALVEHISRGCDIDAVDERGNTPLHLACRHCHVNIAKELLPCMVTVPSLAVPQATASRALWVASPGPRLPSWPARTAEPFRALNGRLRCDAEASHSPRASPPRRHLLWLYLISRVSTPRLRHRADPTLINREGKSPIDYARKAKPSRSSGGAGSDLGRDLEAVLRREAERQRIERQCERAAAIEAEDARARQRAAIEAAAAVRSDDRVQQAAARRQALEVRRGEIQQQRHAAEAAERKSRSVSRIERVRSESSAAGALARRAESAVGTLRRKLSFERKGDHQRKGAQQRKGETALGSEGSQADGNTVDDQPCPDEAGTQPPATAAAAAAAAAVSVGTAPSLARKLSFGRKDSSKWRASSLASAPAAPATHTNAVKRGVSLSDVLQSE